MTRTDRGKEKALREELQWRRNNESGELRIWRGRMVRGQRMNGLGQDAYHSQAQQENRTEKGRRDETSDASGRQRGEGANRGQAQQENRAEDGRREETGGASDRQDRQAEQVHGGNQSEGGGGVSGESGVGFQRGELWGDGGWVGTAG